MRFAAIAYRICLGGVEGFIAARAARPTLNDIEMIFIDEPRDVVCMLGIEGFCNQDCESAPRSDPTMPGGLISLAGRSASGPRAH
jgi:hypothetical protein